MSENTVTADTAAETDETAPETATEPTWTPTDDLSRLLFEKISAQVNEYNSLRTALDSQEGDFTPLLNEMWENSTEENVVEARAEYDRLISQAEDLRARVDAYHRENVSTERWSDEKKAETTAALDVLRKTVREGTSLLDGMYAGAGAAVPTLKGSRAKSSGGTSATGGRKPRVGTIYVNGKPATKEVTSKTGEKSQVSTFTVASAMLGGMPVPDIHKAYFAAGGTDDIEKIAPSLTFAVTHKDVTYEVRVDK